MALLARPMKKIELTSKVVVYVHCNYWPCWELLVKKMNWYELIALDQDSKSKWSYQICVPKGTNNTWPTCGVEPREVLDAIELSQLERQFFPSSPVPCLLGVSSVIFMVDDPLTSFGSFFRFPSVPFNAGDGRNGKGYTVAPRCKMSTSSTSSTLSSELSWCTGRWLRCKFWLHMNR